MAPRIFITGVSGYIGGQLATDLSIKHPEYEIVALVRNDEQLLRIAARLPSITTVKGDLASHEILRQEASKADVVIHAADADATNAVVSLITGLSLGSKGGSFIQVSGAASIVDASNGYGQPSTRVYDDVRDISEITSFDSSHLHWETDQTVIREGKKHGVRTALVVPPVVVGKGEGPVKTTSMVLPWLEEAVLKRGKGFTVGEGRAISSSIHVKDLAVSIILLAEESMKHNGGNATWGSEGFYYIESGEIVMADVIRHIVKFMKERGLIETVEIDQVSDEEATSLHPYALLIWGMNMRCRGSRIGALGWKPTQTLSSDLFSSLFDVSWI